MITMTPPPVPHDMTSVDWLQLAVLVLLWLCVIAAFTEFVRRCVIRGDLLARYEKYVDQHDDVTTFAADCIPTAQQVGRSERTLREKLASHGR